LQRCVIAHVGNDRTDFGAKCRELSGRCVQLFLGAAANGYTGAQGREVLRHAEIDAAAATSHKNGLAVEQVFRKILSD
jgi:hypothetical protein